MGEGKRRKLAKELGKDLRYIMWGRGILNNLIVMQINFDRYSRGN